MKTFVISGLLVSIFAQQGFSAGPAMREAHPWSVQVAQARRTCKSVFTCRDAVILWCSGYRRADADNDGIPCENVCRSRAEVDEIRREIGCRRP